MVVSKTLTTMTNQINAYTRDVFFGRTRLICRFDKGQGIAVLNSDDYVKKLHSIINDTSEFIEI